MFQPNAPVAPDANALAQTIAEAKAWIVEDALPFWSVMGRDDRGGFVEQLDLNGGPKAGSKRMCVQARQIAVFAHAARLGWGEGSLAAARAGFAFITRHGWLEDGGWARRLDRGGAVLDPTLDLQDQAVMLHALAGHYRASGEAAPLEWALRTLDVVDARLTHPSGEGYWHWTPPSGPRLQRPHMRLFEALLALYAATGDRTFLERLERLSDLFRRRFFDPRTQTLAEHFTNDWSRAPGESGRITKPGHHFAWCWLLFEHAKASGRADNRAAALGLFTFAERFGVDPKTGLAFEDVLRDGAVRTASSPCWAQAEALKAHLALFESEGRDTRVQIERAARALLDRYLATPTRGTWIDRYDAAGYPMVETVPARTLHPVFLAFAELVRLEEALTA